jgi:tRNA dimethylallyltransferase
VSRRVVAVVGPTATGKSSYAIRLARQLGGEVINADSMQLYRDMDIGTAKLTVDEREGVPHHLLDVWDVTRTASVADYQLMARDVIEQLLARDVVPILVGGSGLYLRAALDRIDFPGTDPDVRARLEAELDRGGPEPLHDRLRQTDPAAAARIGPRNGRRIVRALEVVALTGESYRAELPEYSSIYDTEFVGLDLPDDELDARIARRVRHMVDAGLLDEVRRLADAGLRDGVTARRALGYAQLLDVIDGRCDLDTAIEQTTARTRRFVRRQRSWFRRDPRITWLAAEGTRTAARGVTMEP